MDDAYLDSAPQSPLQAASNEMETQVGDQNEQLADSASVKRSRKSKVWKSFEKFVEGGKKKARCKKCNQVYSNYGTTNLRRHIAELCKFREATRSGYGDEVEFDQDVFRKIIAESMIKHNLPFKFIEYEKIREAFSYLNPNVELISRNTAKADVLKIYNIGKEKLKRLMESVNGRICLTSDLWSSITSKGYMAVTAHYVDNNWVLRSRLLVFRYLPPPHDGQNVGENLIALLQEWGIEKKIFTITLDNASYNDVVVDMLKHHLRLKNSLVSDGNFLHVRCCSHILNLIVQSGLKTVDEAVEKIRESIKYIKGSDSRTLRFFECVKQMGLKLSKKLQLDVSIRWNSTYLMLDGALLYKSAFSQLNILDKNYKWCPSDEDWRRIVKITNFLRPFFVMTELFSGTNYPTANVYFRNVWRIQMLIQQEMVSEDPVIQNIAMKMRPKFEKYWESYNTILSFAMVMDPRYKLNFIEYAYRKLDPSTVATKLSDLKYELGDLFEEYLLKSSSSVLSQSPIPSGYDTEMDDEFMDEYDAIQSQRRANRRRNQLEKYLTEPPIDRKAFRKMDVLDYWKNNSTTSPALSAMARDILSIPITTIASESAFSHGGRTIGKYRSTILPDNAEAILCGRDWFGAYDSEGEPGDELPVDVENLVEQMGSSSIQS